MSSIINSNQNISLTNKLDENEIIIEEKRTSQNFIIGKKISNLIDDLLLNNKSLSIYSQKNKEQSKMVFNCKKKPKIKIKDYIKRIIQYTGIENSSLIIALIYLDRICLNDILITEYNIHRFLLMSLIISIKYNEDLIFDNKYYSEVAGVSIKEFNSLESEFLTIINFDLYIPDEEFCKYKFYLEKYTN